MKTVLFLSLALLVSSCASCSKGEEDYGPYPGSKKSETTPKSKS